ncbi:MAG: ABC transporter substrate-binding protein [Stappia sp.]|uniref:ABC transporter substrate-binding protein n=1 Tax=Stappia sp. TaxID=1870903 RepID=UPI000C48FA12|nr:ABC transporter substrate-binding protein [Stappia sp.]MAA97516.1 ABC transporter substrate-binding protein [Stappia sp.]MBM22049.1 ABC transporter substrate-binding protein [Stappia sp.]
MKTVKRPLTRALLAAACSSIALAGPALAEELVIGVDSEATSMDPHFHNLGPNNQLGFMMFDRLANPDEKQNFKPGLAVSWKPVDKTTWEFKLREGVKFHDGSDFNADDVICTFERAPNVPNSPAGFGTYTKGKTFEKIDDYTVHVKTDAPYPTMVNDLGNIAIVSNEGGCEGTTEDYNSGKAAAGTGPYKYSEYVPGDRIVLEANPDYWGDKPIWDKVTLKPIKAGPSRVAALLAGDVDIINGVPTTDIATLKARDDVTLSQGVSNRVIYLHIDQFRENSPFVKANGGGDIKNPLLDQKVRKAISKAISRELIRDRVMEGLSIPAGQLLPEGFFGVSENLKPEPYDAEGAKALLAEAGLPDGFELTIHGPNDRYVNDAKIAEAIAQMLTRVGIKTQVETMPRSVYFTRASTGADGLPEFSLILVGWGAGSGEASSPLRALIATFDKEKGMGTANRGRYSNPEVDKVIEEALAEVDDEKRADLLAKATELAIEDLAIIPIHYQVNTWASRKGLKYIPRTDEYTVAYGVVKE